MSTLSNSTRNLVPVTQAPHLHGEVQFSRGEREEISGNLYTPSPGAEGLVVSRSCQSPSSHLSEAQKGPCSIIRLEVSRMQSLTLGANDIMSVVGQCSLQPQCS